MSRGRWHIARILVLVAVVSAASAVAQRSKSHTKSFDVKRGGRLVVDAENVSADIRIKVWEKIVVVVKVDGIAEDDLEHLEVKASDNTVHVEYYGRRGDWRRSRHVRFLISVPSEFDLDLATSGGDIEVDGALKGEIQAATSGGDVEVDDVDGAIHLETSGGDVTARNVTGNCEIKTSGGDIEVGEVGGRLKVRTSGGDITVGDVAKALEAKTAGGDIAIGDVSGDADVATAGGDVEVGRISGSADLRTAGGDIRIRGAVGEVSARTAGGDIQLENTEGSVEAATAGGDIMVELSPSGGRPSSLETRGGDIALYIPENTKATIEAQIRLRARWGDDDEYDIYSDFKPQAKERNRKGIHAKFVLNGGGPTIILETMHGDIEIRKLKR